MNEWIVRRGTLERQVPDTSTLVRLVRDNRLKPTDLVFDSVSNQWLNASDVSVLKSVFEGLADTSSNPRSAGVTAAQNAGPANTTGPLPSASPSVSAISGWGASSRAFAIIGGAVAIFGGVTLLGLKSAGENSMIEALAHGIGIYCIGKGLFMIAAVTNARAAVDSVLQEIRRLL